MRLAVFLALGAVACAKGGAAGDDTSLQIDAAQTRIDANQGAIDGPPARIDAGVTPDSMPGAPDANVPPDANSVLPPDANVPPQAITLSQNTSTTIEDGDTVECAQSDAVTGQIQFSYDNQFWRAFSITNQVTVHTINLGVDGAQTTNGSGTQPIVITLFTSAGAFPGGTRTQIATQTFQIGNVSNVIIPETFTNPVVVPAGSTLVVEISSADESAKGNGNYFLMGSNVAGQSGESYVSSTFCGITTPSAYDDSSVFNPPFTCDLVFTVAGTTP